MKHYYLSIFLVILLSTVCTTSFAHDIEVVNSDGKTIYYIINDDGNTLTVSFRGNKPNSYENEYTGDVDIPETVTYSGKTYTVTSISYEAFSGCSGMTSITISNSVTSIGNFAFWNCGSLTSVSFPNSMKSIGAGAFSDCSGLTSVTIPNSVTSISNDAFAGTTWYDKQPDGVVYAGNVAYKYKGAMPDNTNITLNEGTVSISSGAFDNCSGLTSVYIPGSVTSIGEHAFSGCSGLTSVTIPNSVTNIDLYAFSGCSGLTSIIISNRLTSIEKFVFENCGGLTSVTIPDNVTSIGEGAFRNCSSLTSVTIPNSVTEIGESAFQNCSSLTSVTIPNSVTWMGYYAFDGCSGLTSVTIGNSVTSIGSYAFNSCSGLTSVTIPNSVTHIGSIAFSGCSSLTSVTIPNSVTSIGSSAFQGCSGLTSVTIPNSVTSIDDYAFSDCSGLTSLTIPNSVTSISEGVFDRCSGLASVTIPNSVTNIGSYVFYGCSGLTSVTIPGSVTSIGPSAFYGCTALTTFKIRATVPPLCDWSTLDDINNETCILYVPSKKIAVYKKTDYWNKFIHIEELNAQGDSNGDDEINERDYSCVASFIMGDTPETYDAEACDVDENGTVDVRDYVGIANIISTGSIYGGANNNAKAVVSKGMAMPVTDESDAENVIYVENVSGSKNSQVELSVCMRNASDIRGFQFDLYLPEGVSMANNAKASLSSDRLAVDDAHTLMVNKVSDGAVRFLCSSMNDESFAVGDGEIATLTVNIADNVANGDYDVVVKNALMTETDISKSYEADNIKSTLKVLDQTGVETVTADDERRDGSIYTVGGQLVGKKSTTSQLRKGIYIRNGKKIVVK